MKKDIRDSNAFVFWLFIIMICSVLAFGLFIKIFNIPNNQFERNNKTELKDSTYNYKNQIKNNEQDKY